MKITKIIWAMKTHFYLIFCLLLSTTINAQRMGKSVNNSTNPKAIEEAKEFQQDTINGVYIPKNLEDCFIQLDQLLSDEDKQTIKQLRNRKETIQYHHNLGMALRNNWGLWSGSRLQKYMLDKKVKHPDNMSGIILEFYYDWLNGQNDKWKKFEAK